jgi:hypothetical protein
MPRKFIWLGYETWQVQKSFFFFGSYVRELRNNHDDVKYIMDQALLPPGASGGPKHMHLVRPISSEWPERRNRKAPTP